MCDINHDNCMRNLAVLFLCAQTCLAAVLDSVTAPLAFHAAEYVIDVVARTPLLIAFSAPTGVISGVKFVPASRTCMDGEPAAGGIIGMPLTASAGRPSSEARPWLSDRFIPFANSTLAGRLAAANFVAVSIQGNAAILDLPSGIPVRGNYIVCVRETAAGSYAYQWVPALRFPAPPPIPHPPPAPDSPDAPFPPLPPVPPSPADAPPPPVPSTPPPTPVIIRVSAEQRTAPLSVPPASSSASDPFRLILAAAHDDEMPSAEAIAEAALSYIPAHLPPPAAAWVRVDRVFHERPATSFSSAGTAATADVRVASLLAEVQTIAPTAPFVARCRAVQPPRPPSEGVSGPAFSVAVPSAVAPDGVLEVSPSSSCRRIVVDVRFTVPDAPAILAHTLDQPPPSEVPARVVAATAPLSDIDTWASEALYAHAHRPVGADSTGAAARHLPTTAATATLHARQALALPIPSMSAAAAQPQRFTAGAGTVTIELAVDVPSAEWGAASSVPTRATVAALLGTATPRFSAVMSDAITDLIASAVLTAALRAAELASRVPQAGGASPSPSGWNYSAIEALLAAPSDLPVDAAGAQLRTALGLPYGLPSVALNSVEIREVRLAPPLATPPPNYEETFVIALDVTMELVSRARLAAAHHAGDSLGALSASAALREVVFGGALAAEVTAAYADGRILWRPNRTGLVQRPVSRPHVVRVTCDGCHTPPTVSPTPTPRWWGPLGPAAMPAPRHGLTSATYRAMMLAAAVCIFAGLVVAVVLGIVLWCCRKRLPFLTTRSRAAPARRPVDVTGEARIDRCLAKDLADVGLTEDAVQSALRRQWLKERAAAGLPIVDTDAGASVRPGGAHAGAAMASGTALRPASTGASPHPGTTKTSRAPTAGAAARTPGTATSEQPRTPPYTSRQGSVQPHSWGRSLEHLEGYVDTSDAALAARLMGEHRNGDPLAASADRAHLYGPHMSVAMAAHGVAPDAVVTADPEGHPHGGVVRAGDGRAHFGSPIPFRDQSPGAQREMLERHRQQQQRLQRGYWDEYSTAGTPGGPAGQSPKGRDAGRVRVAGAAPVGGTFSGGRGLPLSRVRGGGLIAAADPVDASVSGAPRTPRLGSSYDDEVAGPMALLLTSEPLGIGDDSMDRGNTYAASGLQPFGPSDSHLSTSTSSRQGALTIGPDRPTGPASGPGGLVMPRPKNAETITVRF